MAESFAKRFSRSAIQLLTCISRRRLRVRPVPFEIQLARPNRRHYLLGVADDEKAIQDNLGETIDWKEILTAVYGRF
jgi:hypothetical protein